MLNCNLLALKLVHNNKRRLNMYWLSGFIQPYRHFRYQNVVSL